MRFGRNSRLCSGSSAPTALAVHVEETVVTGEIVELFVLRNGDRWTVMSDGVTRGNFDYQVDAEEAAIRLAEGARAKGRSSGVISPDRGSQMRRVWPI